MRTGTRLWTVLLLVSAVLCQDKARPHRCPPRCLCYKFLPHVSCRRKNIREISPHLPQSTKQLDYSNNVIKAVPDFVFSKMDRLEELNLNKNMLTEEGITQFSFLGLYNLGKLYMANNHFGVISRSMFQHLSRLKYLDMAGNRIYQVQLDAFYYLRNLQSLVMKYDNPRAPLPSSALHIGTLRMLRLYGRMPQKTVPRGLFAYLYNVEYIEMFDMGIRRVDRDLIYGSQKLWGVSMDMNKLRDLPEDLFRYNKNLKSISLTFNRFRDVPMAVKRVTWLENLYFSGNPVRLLTPQSFEGLEELKLLHIGAIPGLVTISRTFFLNVPNLEFLSLSGNRRLRKIQKEALLYVPKLKMLSMDRCNLTSLDKSTLSGGYLRVVSMQDNPWSCDCRLKWLTELLAGEENVRVTSKEEMTCSQPKRLAGMKLEQVPPNEFICR
ncbi:leucine-rich repeat and immunoglobulin-like domain-containing nogo receptor-interacting protein 1 [Branchiostoma lanceolatum]|uniref:leucine-rich repeat and immunoglobulin-like domain-containing nogo receptor-interacting protein 1 n=1 Tax=Branchiostoma lanceolatum TaxID=7740 RepID=UPI0034514863